MPLVCLAVVTLPARKAGAGNATLQAGNSPATTNLTENGDPLDSRFHFEIGTFDPGIVATPSNVLEWVDHWYPLTDALGKVLEEATVSYNDAELGYPFDPGTRVNQFSINVTLTHNFSPFDSGRPIYVWGFDRRLNGGSVEWILITNPSWTWPTIEAGTEPIIRSLDVSHPDTVAIIGQVNAGGVEMRTATVELSTSLSGYNAWLANHFTAEERGDPALEATRWGFLADADGDTIPNAIEFVSGTGPTSSASAPVMDVTRSGNLLSFAFTRRKDTGTITAVAQWCSDLSQWTSNGVTEAVIEDLGDFERIEATVVVPAGNRAFMRLRAIE